MEQVVVAEIVNVQEWQGSDGAMRTYEISFSRADGDETFAKWYRPASSSAPKVGDRVTGTFAPGKSGLNFKLAKKGEQKLNGQAPLSEPPSFGKTNTDDRPLAIQRQHSQEMALRFAAQAGTSLEQITELTDHFERDIASGAGPEENAVSGPTLGAPPALVSEAQVNTLLERINTQLIPEPDVLAKLATLGAEADTVQAALAHLPKAKIPDLVDFIRSAGVPF